MSAYQVRRVKIGTSEQLDTLARECGRLYSQTLVSFWRTVRHQGIWLGPKHLMRWPWDLPQTVVIRWTGTAPGGDGMPTPGQAIRNR